VNSGDIARIRLSSLADVPGRCASRAGECSWTVLGGGTWSEGRSRSHVILKTHHYTPPQSLEECRLKRTSLRSVLLSKRIQLPASPFERPLALLRPCDLFYFAFAINSHVILRSVRHTRLEGCRKHRVPPSSLRLRPRWATPRWSSHISYYLKIHRLSCWRSTLKFVQSPPSSGKLFNTSACSVSDKDPSPCSAVSYLWCGIFYFCALELFIR